MIVCVAASLLTFFFITSDITRRKGMVWSDTLGGVVVGIFFAALTLTALDSTLVQHYGLSLSAAFSGRTIVPLFSGLVAAGLLAGLLPAMRCYRRSLSDGLSPETGG